MLDRMDALQRLWDDALVDAAKANAAEENTAGDGGVDTQYSIDRNFSSAIDAWNGVDNTVFRVGETSDALREIGVQGRPIVWYGGKIAKILRQHSGMTRAIIKQVPEILEHPVVILKSKSSESRLAIFGEVRDTSGAPVTAILELQPTNRGGELLDMNVIASAYGKDSSPARFIQSSGLIYLDPNKNRTDRWLRAVGLRLPSVARASYGSLGSVTYQDGKVKIESVPFAQYMQASEKGDMKNPGGSQNQRGVKGKLSKHRTARHKSHFQ